MIEWIVSSCVLIILIIGIRKVFRKKLDARVLYALWLLVAVRLLVPYSFAESRFSVQNLIREAVGNEQVSTSDTMPGEAAKYEDFFVEGDTTAEVPAESNFFAYMKQKYDNCFKVTNVDVFELIPHLEVGGA